MIVIINELKSFSPSCFSTSVRSEKSVHCTCSLVATLPVWENVTGNLLAATKARASLWTLIHTKRSEALALQWKTEETRFGLRFVHLLPNGNLATKLDLHGLP